MLANSRTPSDTARAKYDTSSISTSLGTSPNGVPLGTKNAKKWIPWRCRPMIVTAIQIITDRPIDTITDVVIVNEYGTLPVRFEISTKKNSE
jgi:hypothetical protein